SVAPLRSSTLFPYTTLFRSGEAKTLTFHTSYAAIPRKMRPIVLGALRFPSPQDMTLDVRSCERATQAVVFFDRSLKPSIARVTQDRKSTRLNSSHVEISYAV